MSPLYAKYKDEWGPSRHMTNVFNVFVWLQIFNMLNARKINDEKNIFTGIFSNYMYLIVWVIIIVGQVIIVLFGGYAFKVSLSHIAPIQWLLAILFGVGQLFVDLVIKFVPDHFCPQFGSKAKKGIDDSFQIIPMIRRSRT